MQILSRPLIGLLAFAATLGCAASPLTPEIAKHVVTIDADGSRAASAAALPEVAGGSDGPAPSPHADLIAALRAHAQKTGGKRVLVFIHGGLNSRADSIRRATDLTPRIERTGTFPIFIHWRSSLTSSYLEHLTSVRQGRRWKRFPAAITLPAVAASDGLRAVARWPIMSVLQLANGMDEVGQRIFKERWRESESRLKNDPSLDFHPGTDSRSNARKSVASALRVAFFPTQLLSAGALDAVGKSAWDMLLRRTDLMFHRDSRNERGALAEFLDELARELDSSWDVTLVGHSMGAIVANRILTEHASLDFDRIVYMAAASSVGDYEDAVLPYLRAHPSTQMYHLTLNHKSENRETPVALFLQGSLLVWIDDFLSTPITPRGRSVGRYVNLVSAAERPEAELRARIHIKEFDAGPEHASSDPQTHGSFTECLFWDPRFWQPSQNPRVCPGAEQRQEDAGLRDSEEQARVER